MGTPGRRSASAGWIKFNVFQCRDYGLQALPINQIVTSTRNGARKLLERSFFCYPINWDEGLEKMIQHYNEHPADNTSQYPGVKEGLATLKSVDSFEQFIQYLLKAGYNLFRKRPVRYMSAAGQKNPGFSEKLFERNVCFAEIRVGRA